MLQTTDRQTTDGRAIAYSEHEHEFTFAKTVLFIRPHRSTTYVDAACVVCLLVCWSVCRSVCQTVTIVSPAETAE